MKRDLFILVHLDAQRMTGKIETIEPSNNAQRDAVLERLNTAHRLTTGECVAYPIGQIEDTMFKVSNLFDVFNALDDVKQ